MSTKLKAWMAAATPKEQAEMARRARTSRAYMYAIANSGANASRADSAKRRVSPELAGKMERAALTMREKNPKLPALLRPDLSPTCAGCEYAKRCLRGEP